MTLKHLLFVCFRGRESFHHLLENLARLQCKALKHWLSFVKKQSKLNSFVYIPRCKRFLWVCHIHLIVYNSSKYMYMKHFLAWKRRCFELVTCGNQHIYKLSCIDVSLLCKILNSWIKSSIKQSQRWNSRAFFFSYCCKYVELKK